MVKQIKKIFIVILLISSTLGVVYAISQEEDFYINFAESFTDNYQYINDIMLKSSRYTQPTNVSQEQLDLYNENYKDTFTLNELAILKYEKALENDNFILYFNPISLAVIVYNKQTNYYWTSTPFNQLVSDGNTRARQLMSSGVIINYINKTTVDKSIVTTTSILELFKAPFSNAPDDLSEKLKPIYFDSSSVTNENIAIDYNINSNKKMISININAKGFTNLNNRFEKLDFKFDLFIELTNKGIKASIPQESIYEGTDNYKILSIALFPYLGAAREDTVPGYFVIPDGIGALVRLNREHNTTFSSSFYGMDLGYQLFPDAYLSLPIYGITHLEGSDAFYANVLSGAEHSRLIANYWGSSTKFHSIYVQYNVRNLYKTIIDRQGNGYITILDQKFSQDFIIDYSFLSHDDASYVGMAKDFQEQLVVDNTLTKKEVKNNNQIPLLTGYIMSDREPSFIGTSKVVMSSVDDVKNMNQTLYNENIHNQYIILYGWSEDGFIYTSPYGTNMIESKQSFGSLTQFAHDKNQKIYVHNDYIWASEQSGRFNSFTDAVYGISKTQITYNNINYLDDIILTYRIYPSIGLSMLHKDNASYQDMGFDGVYLDSIGYSPFSYYHNDTYYDRAESIRLFNEIATVANETLADAPSSFLWKNINAYLFMSIYNEQYDYYSDLVPLLPIILKGYMSYFTDFLNFNALGKDRILNLIDFGMNPSYVLTKEETSKMRYTNAAGFYTTYFTNYKNEIVDTYNYINNALKHVIDQSIVSREILTYGVVKVTYENNVSIYVNYSSKAYTHGSVTISAYDYKVVL